MISLGSTKQPFMGIGEVAKKSLDSSFPTGHFLSHTRHEPRHRWHRLSLTHFPQRFPIDSRWCLLQISKSPLQPWKVTWKNWPGTSKNGFVRCEQKYFLVIFLWNGHVWRFQMRCCFFFQLKSCQMTLFKASRWNFKILKDVARQSAALSGLDWVRWGWR